MTTTTTMKTTTKIELKRVEYSARMSEETACFAADIHIDGKRVGAAQNNGQGGSTIVHLTAEGRAEATAAILAYGETIAIHAFDKESVDAVVDRMLTLHLMRKDAAKLLKSQLCFLNAAGKLQATKKLNVHQLTMLHALPEDQLFTKVPWAKGLRLLKTVDEITAALVAEEIATMPEWAKGL